MGKKHITAKRVAGGARCVRLLRLSVGMCLWQMRNAMLWIAQLSRGRHRSLLITPVTAFSFYMTALQNSLRARLNTTQGCGGELVKSYLRGINLGLFTSDWCISFGFYLCGCICANTQFCLCLTFLLCFFAETVLTQCWLYWLDIQPVHGSWQEKCFYRNTCQKDVTKKKKKSQQQQIRSSK